MGVCLSIEGPAKLFVSLGQYIFFSFVPYPNFSPLPFPRGGLRANALTG